MRILMLSHETDNASVIPALDLLPHTVVVCAPDLRIFLEDNEYDVVLVDSRNNLAEMRSFCGSLATVCTLPVISIFTEGGLVVLSPEWKVDDLLLTTASPAEVDARLRMVVARLQENSGDAEDGVITLGDLLIDENTYVARLKGRPLDLAYKEFELLKFLCQHPGRVFSRTQLLQEVWGYDFVGGTRTVDVHVRRLRAKLGPEYEALITTVRNVGYKAVESTSDRKTDNPLKATPCKTTSLEG